MNNVLGSTLIIVGLIIAIYGDKDISVKGKSILEILRPPLLHRKAIKYGAVFVFIYVGVGVLLKWWN